MISLRPATREDHEAVLRVLAARELGDSGATAILRTELLGQWRVDRFDPAVDSVVAVQDGSVIGYGAVFSPGAIAFVEAAHEGRGLGFALLEWVEQRARVLRRDAHRQAVAGSNVAAHALLDGAGYTQVRSVLLMRRTLHSSPAVPTPPAGITLHELDPERDARALHAADNAAFADNPDYEPGTFESFREEHLRSPELDPGLSRVARRDTTVAGFTLCRRSGPSIGYIDLLAVDKRERRQGLGTVLLLSAFASFAEAGLHEAQLDVASDNPVAVRLYERAGMTGADRLDVFEKPEPSAGRE